MKTFFVLNLFASFMFLKTFTCIEDDDYLFIDEETPEFAESIPNITVAIGRDAKLPCIVNNLGSYRAAWLRIEEKDILTIHHHIITRNYRISLLENHNDNRNFILVIKNVHESDRGGYMCQINTVPMKSQVGFIDVVVPPDIIVEESSSDVVITEGSNVTLKCKARGYPLPEIQWRREDGERVPLGDWQGRKHTNNKTEGENLTISRVTRVHSGAWLCIASNGVMPSVSRRILLHVQFSPQIWLPSQLVGAPLGKNVSLDCHIEAFPQSVNHWLKDNDVLIVANDKYEISIKEKGYKRHLRLTILHLQQTDLGKYHCYAKNPLGSQESAVKLYAIEINELSYKESFTNKRQSLERNNRQNIIIFNNEFGAKNKNYFDREFNDSIGQKSVSNSQSNTLSFCNYFVYISIEFYLLIKFNITQFKLS